ncbi:hypothetical protein BH09BAC1_BH09BAC1_22600 [soil metagenome]
MSCIGKNIKKIRTVKKINQADFADLFGLARASVGSYEEGRAEPKIDTIIAIANHFGIAIDLLLKKELTINELYRFDIFKPELHHAIVSEPQAPQLAPPALGIALVGGEKTDEYISQKGAVAYTKQLPQLHLSFLPKGNYRAIEVMESIDKLAKGDVVIGRKLTNKEQHEKGRVYVLLTPTKLLIATAAEVPSTTEEILERWEVTHTIAAFNPAPLGSLEERVLRLEGLVKEIRG